LDGKPAKEIEACQPWKPNKMTIMMIAIEEEYGGERGAAPGHELTVADHYIEVVF
jgi:hypothetical protein